MRAIIQRVSNASVHIDNQKIAYIGVGVLAFIGFEQEDRLEDLTWMSKKIISLRIFQDQENKINLSLDDVDGDILVVSQFSLYALTKKGNRPSFVNVCKYKKANYLYNEFMNIMNQNFTREVYSGIFGEDMKINLINDGPLTFFIDTKSKE